MSDYRSIVSYALLKSLVAAPPLIGNLPEADIFPHQELTFSEDSNKFALELNLEQKLGHLYEDAMMCLLQHSPRYADVVKGLQLREESGRTLGELDFLLLDQRTAKHIHLELAVKFYLAVESGDSLLLPGPDARDHYFRKLQKMRTHQLTLTHRFRKLLPEAHHESEIVAQQLVHGCIFDHIKARQFADAEFLNPHGRRGKWLHVDECEAYFHKTEVLEIIPKVLWPAPLKYFAHLKLEPWQPPVCMDRCVMVRARSRADTLPYFIAPTGYPSPAA